MPETNSLWETLEAKPKTLVSSNDLYKILSERSKLENQRPHGIEYAEMEQVVEKTMLHRVEEVEIKPNLLNITYYVLKNPQTNQYFRLDEKEKFLWKNMDGEHTIRDLALEYFNQYGAFAYEKIVELVYDLKKKTFLHEEYVDIYQNLSLWAKSKYLIYKLWNVLKKFFYWDFPIKKIDPFFSFLYNNFFKILFLKFSRYILFFTAVIGLGAFVIVSENSPYALLHYNDSVVLGVLLLFVLNLISLLFHELAHGLTTKYFGRSVQRAGFFDLFRLAVILCRYHGHVDGRKEKAHYGFAGWALCGCDYCRDGEHYFVF